MPVFYATFLQLWGLNWDLDSKVAKEMIAVNQSTLAVLHAHQQTIRSPRLSYSLGKQLFSIINYDLLANAEGNWNII